MAPKNPIGLVAAALERGLARLAVLAHARPGAMLSALVVLTALSVLQARNLTVDADVTALLPESFQSIKDLHVLEERFGGVGFLVVVARNAGPEALKRFADAAAPKIEALESVKYVDFKRPTSYFFDRGLYYADAEHLKKGRERIERRLQWEKRKRNTFIVDFEQEDEPPKLVFDDLIESYDGGTSQKWVIGAPDESYYYDPAQRMLALLVKPGDMASDLDYNRKLIADVQGAVDSLDPKSYDPDLKVEMTGRYKKRVDQQDQVVSDLSFCSLLALALMVFYLAFHFRRIMAVLLVVVPLLGALTWTLAATSLIFGQMNILTGFVAAILLGLGIDHGIHLLGRYELERATREAGDALTETFAHTGRAVSIAAFTTLAAFLALSVSEFRAFHEFGVVAAMGVGLAAAAYTTALPAMIGLAERYGWRPRKVGHDRDSVYARAVAPHAGKLLGAFLLLCALVAWRIPDARFDYDFASLEGSNLPSFHLDLQVNKVLGYSEMPVVVLTDDEDTERAVVAALRERKKEYGDKSGIDFVASAADLIPTNQDEKHAILKKLAKRIRKVKRSWLPEKHRDRLDELKRMVNAKPFGRKDLPEQIRRQFQGEEAKGEQGYVLVFPSIPTTDGVAMREFAEEVRNVPLEGGKSFSASGEAMILADVLNLLLAEAPKIVGLTLLLVVMVLWLLLGRLIDVALCLAAPVLTVVLMVGVMPFGDITVNYLNLIFLPVLFGVAVDGAVHVVTRLREGDPLDIVVGDTGRAIAGAILTTALGFGTLLLADHPGLNSVARLMLLGLVANLLASLVALPAILGVMARKREIAA